MWGSGKQKRPFLFVDDLVRATLLLREHAVTGTEYVSPPETVEIRDLAIMIRDLIHPKLPLAFDTSKPEGPEEILLPTVHPLLQKMPWTLIQEGLERTRAAFLAEERL